MELEKINFILSLLLITVGMVIGCCCLLLSVPPKQHLQNYRIARISMGIGYLLLGIFMTGEIILLSIIESDANIIRIIILTLSSFLALLFTYSSVTLINVRFSTKQKLKTEAIPIGIISTLNWIAYFVSPGYLSIAFITLFIIYYIFILIKYTTLFYNTTKKYKEEINIFFPEYEWKRLKWINFSFYCALLVEILALLSLFSLNIGFVIFKAFIIPFYIYYGFNLINYGFKFRPEEPVHTPKKQNEINSTDIRSVSYNELESLINQWTEQKKYLRAGITIEYVSSELNTNRTYLSTYINLSKKQTFREWINQLRIDEAKQLLLNNPELPINEIGKIVGYSDKSNFTRQFIKVTNTSPLQWKKENTIR
jgi:AraC-like DNA-binding protein